MSSTDSSSALFIKRLSDEFEAVTVNIDCANA